MKRFLLDRRMYVEYMVAAVLFAADILLTLFMPYLTEHKRYYDSDAYIVTLVIAFLLYTVSVHATRKKSASDIAVVLFAFFAVWEIAYKTGAVQNDLLIPSPEGLFHVFVEKPEEIWQDVLGSLQLLFWGFFLAILLGTILGLLAGWIPQKELGANAVIFFAVFWPTFQGTVSRVSKIDKAVIEAAKTMGVGTLGMLARVIFPYCLPGIIKSISKSLRGAFMCLTGAEMLGINLGIGYFIEKYKSFADYRCVLAGIVTVGVITTVIDILVNKAEKTLIRWEE